MAYKISGTMSEDSRIIVLKESDWSIESNTLVSGTSYELSIDDDANRVVIGRSSNGTVVGYGGVTPELVPPSSGTITINNANEDGWYFDIPYWLIYYTAGSQDAYSYVTLGHVNTNKECSPTLLFHLNDTIPSGATIDSATVRFRQRGINGSGTIKGRIYCEKSASPTFKTDRTSAQNQTLTTNSVAWDVSTSETNGTFFTTPDFKSVVQEVLNAHGDIDDIHVIINEDGGPESTSIQFDAYGSSGSTNPAELTITWS